LKWEERLRTENENGGECDDVIEGEKRELEWGEIAREVALMNRPYAR
jgi:dual specificity MAP kinase phosphatase